MRRSLWVIGAIWGALSGPANGQEPAGSIRGGWALGVSVSAWSFGAASRGADEDGYRLAFFPHRSAIWGLRLGYGGAGTRLELAAGYGMAGLGAQGEESEEEGRQPLLVFYDAYKVYSVAAIVSDHLVRLYGGPSLRGSVGIGIQGWHPPGDPGKTIAAAQAGLSVEIPLSRAWVASVEGEVGFTPASPFAQATQPEGFRVRSTWRKSLGALVSWRF